MSNRLVKVIMWRVISIIVTMLVMITATGNVKAATSITLFLHMLLLTCHYLFETVWEKHFED